MIFTSSNSFANSWFPSFNDKISDWAKKGNLELIDFKSISPNFIFLAILSKTSCNSIPVLKYSIWKRLSSYRLSMYLEKYENGHLAYSSNLDTDVCNVFLYIFSNISKERFDAIFLSRIFFSTSLNSSLVFCKKWIKYFHSSSTLLPSSISKYLDKTLSNNTLFEYATIFSLYIPLILLSSSRYFNNLFTLLIYIDGLLLPPLKEDIW